MNLNLAICDDEIKDIELLKKHILQYTIETDNNITVSSYTSAKKLISEYNNHSYNVVLLDIEMPDLSGMELAKQLRDVDDDLLIVLPHFILNICRKALMCSLSSFLQSLLITPLYPGCSVVFLKSLTVVPEIL